MNILKTSLLTAFILMTGSFAFAVDTTSSQSACENYYTYNGVPDVCVETNGGWWPCESESWNQYTSAQKKTCCCASQSKQIDFELCKTIPDYPSSCSD